MPTQPEPIEEYLGRYSTENTGINTIDTQLRLLYRFASERLGLPNPVDKIKRARGKSKLPQHLTISQALALINASQNDRERVLIACLLGLGRRLSKVRRLLGDSVNCAIWSPRLFEDLTERLRGYFGGHKAVFPDRLDLSGATSFQREVWEITRLIPYGETRSYTWVAERIKEPGAVRAVGQALARNPLPVIIPCHRVLNIDGKLGGYSGGVEMKRHLLFLEASASSR